MHRPKSGTCHLPEGARGVLLGKFQSLTPAIDFFSPAAEFDCRQSHPDGP
jgi:hypothetical protein